MIENWVQNGRSGFNHKFNAKLLFNQPYASMKITHALFLGLTDISSQAYEVSIWCLGLHSVVLKVSD